jgi:uncharacterized protein YecE (DUF72 family)
MADPSWFTDRTYEILAKEKVAFCIYNLAGNLFPKEVATNFVCVRLQGPKVAYQGQYDGKPLSGWAGAFSNWARQEKEIFCYFDNDQAGYAVQDALKPQKMVSKE